MNCSTGPKLGRWGRGGGVVILGDKMKDHETIVVGVVLEHCMHETLS